MHLDSITLHEVVLTRPDGSRGEALIVQATYDGHHGWSEIAVGTTPWHGVEFADSAWLFATQHAIPVLLEAPPVHPSGTGVRLEGLKGHPKTKMALELALWDLYARTHSARMLDALGGGSKNLTFRAKIGIKDTLQELEKIADFEINRGITALHVSITPGWDIDPISMLRSTFPATRVIADAGGSFHPTEAVVFKTIERVGIEALVDPFSKDDTEATRGLASGGGIDVWLRARHWSDVAEAAHSSIAGLMLDTNEFGGFRPLLDVATYCMEEGLSGVLEPGGSTLLAAGQAALLAAATGLDAGPLAHYFGQWGRDIVKPGWRPGKHGLEIPTGLGTGLTVDRPYLQRQTRRTETISA